MSANKINAHIKKDQAFNYQATDPAGYYYMFTGGYGYQNGQITSDPVGDDDGPAGEAALSEATGSWDIKVKDDTGEKFKIVQWNLGGTGIPGATFDPAPDTDIDGTNKLTITASNIPSGHHNSFDGYTITLENENGTRVKLDPRVYDVRE